MTWILSCDIVQLTLGLLVTFSVLTWSVIFLKTWEQWRLNRANRSYNASFWRAADLESAADLSRDGSALARVAESGFDLLRDMQSGNNPRLHLSGNLQEVMERSLRQQIHKERKNLEQGLSLLASIGSTAPFVGLFGTVWGIMHALQDISRSGSASLDVVAGPIGEALIATAIGIAAAIPAVLAYNFFLRRVKLCEAELEYFATDFLHLAIKAGLKRETA